MGSSSKASSPDRTGPGWLRWAAPFGLVGMGAALRALITPLIGAYELPFIFFFPAVAASAWFGGLGPGLLAMALSCAAATALFFGPLSTVPGLVAFGVAGGVILWAVESARRAENRLEKEVDARTGELQDIVAELEQVSYTLSHDMRAPLRAMNVFAELLEDEARLKGWPAQTQEHCRRIQAAAGRLDRMIRDALAYNRAVIEDLPMSEVDLSKLIADLIETYPEFDPEKADVLIDGDLPPVRGHEALLAQCLSHLVGNAVKFVAPGRRPSVRIHAEDRGGRVRLWVEDNGIGIPKANAERILTMLEKVERKREGTGVGLPVVRKVVQKMGGSIGFESVVGKGSRFWVELPAAPVEHP